MTKQADHVKRRRAEGLCSYEGCPEKTAAYRCEKHAAAHAARVRAYVKAKREAAAAERGAA